MIVLDTSAIYAFLNTKDVNHRTAIALLATTRSPYVLPLVALTELAWLVESRYGPFVFDRFLERVIAGEFRIDSGTDDLPRIRQLVRKYADLPLGFADATIIACTERLRTSVATFDLRHFPVVAREGTFKIAE